MANRYAFESELDEAFEERFQLLDEHGEVREDFEPPQDWQDDIHELADSAVPVYTADLMELWTALGWPEVDDPGLIAGITDIHRIIAVSVYEYAAQYLYELADKYEFDN